MICRLGVIFVIAAYTSVTSALPPCVCTREMKPVCGTDGRTYPSRCAMDCDAENRGNVEVVHEGECTPKREVAAERECICPHYYLPVCGTDGQTYENECNVKCRGNVEVAYRGNCKFKREACFCPMNYDPVCGSNGKTYDNKCALNCVGDVQVAYSGPCRSKRRSNYHNHYRYFSTVEECLQACPVNFYSTLVCGSDGEFYTSVCRMNCKNRYATVAHDSFCWNSKRKVE